MKWQSVQCTSSRSRKACCIDAQFGQICLSYLRPSSKGPPHVSVPEELLVHDVIGSQHAVHRLAHLLLMHTPHLVQEKGRAWVRRVALARCALPREACKWGYLIITVHFSDQAHSKLSHYEDVEGTHCVWCPTFSNRSLSAVSKCRNLACRSLYCNVTSHHASDVDWLQVHSTKGSRASLCRKPTHFRHLHLCLATPVPAETQLPDPSFCISFNSPLLPFSPFPDYDLLRNPA